MRRVAHGLWRGSEDVMAGIGPLRLLSKVGITSALLFSSASLLTGQGLAKPSAPASSPAEDVSDVHALALSVRELQAEVQALNSEVNTLRAEAGELRGQLDLCESDKPAPRRRLPAGTIQCPRGVSPRWPARCDICTGDKFIRHDGPTPKSDD